jgi:GTP1/Obg family GTP-binding protein
MQETLIAAVVAISIAVVELAKGAISKLRNGGEHNTRRIVASRVETILDRVEDLHETHSVRDSDGVPLFYFPRSIQQTQNEMLSRLQSIAEIQRQTLELLRDIRTDLRQGGGS